MSQTSTNRIHPVALATESASISSASIALLHQFSHDLIASHDLNVILRKAVLAAAQLTDAQHATLLLLNSTGQQIQYRIALDNGNLAPLELVAKPMMRKGMAGWVVHSHTTALVHDTENDRRWLPGPGLGDLRSALVAPLIYAERVLGILTLGSEQPGHYLPEHVRLIEILCAHVAGALYLARATRPKDEPPASSSLPRTQDTVALASELRGFSLAAANLAPNICFGEVLDVCSRTLAQIVRRHHGLITHADADTLLAVFEAAGNGAGTAACAALEIQAALQRLGADWQQLGLMAALPNIGIASGTALLGRLSADGKTNSAVGPVIARSLRLRELARSGEILTCDTISATLSSSNRFEITALPPLRLGTMMTEQIYRLRPAHAESGPASHILNRSI